MTHTDDALTGRRALVVTTNYGVEQDELLVPVRALRDSGAQVDVAAVSDGPVRTLVGDRDPGETVQPTQTLAVTDPADYDLLLVPGGTLNADSLRLDDTALHTVRAFAATGRPVAAICHGPWLLVEAGVVTGKTLTSYPSLRTDIVNAGGVWVDKAGVSDDTGGWMLVTSRTPRDLDDFLRAVTSAVSLTRA